MIWNWEYAISIIPRLLDALTITLQAAFFSTLLALAVGLLFALGKRSRIGVLQVTTYWVVEFIRRTPILIQIYIVFFVLPDLGITLSALTAGILALGLHTSAYLSEVYRAGIDAVPTGQWEASKALNIPNYDIWTKIILPQAIPPMIPAGANYVLILFKETSLLSTITVIEMMGMARIIGNETYRYLEPITLVGVVYLVISVPAAMGLRYLEDRIKNRVRSEPQVRRS